jgi:hypothetical protein
MVKARVRRPPLASGSASDNASAAGLNDIDLTCAATTARTA